MSKSKSDHDAKMAFFKKLWIHKPQTKNNATRNFGTAGQDRNARRDNHSVSYSSAYRNFKKGDLAISWHGWDTVSTEIQPRRIAATNAQQEGLAFWKAWTRHWSFRNSTSTHKIVLKEDPAFWKAWTRRYSIRNSTSTHKHTNHTEKEAQPFERHG